MASLRIYLFANTKSKTEDIKNKILSNKELFAKFEDDQIKSPGFHGKILELVSDNYYVSDYFEIGEKSIPSLKSELAYFNYLESSTKSESKQHPILIKLVYNSNKNVICFYTRAKISNDTSNRVIQTLYNKNVFDFKFNPEIYTYREEKLNALVNALEIKDFKLITVWDLTNKVSIKSPSGSITETQKYLELIKEQRGGNWTHLEIPFDDLDIILKISKTTKNFITFEKDYVDDSHLVRAIDFLINKIFNIEDFSGKRQTFLNSF